MKAVSLQVQGLECDKEGRVWEMVRLGEVPANSRGYFKLKSAAEDDATASGQRQSFFLSCENDTK